MQNKTDKGTLLVSKSLPVANLNSVNRLFSDRKKKYYISPGDKKRGNIPINILDPHLDSCEELITYNLNGEIIPAGRDKEKVQTDIDLLGLNCKHLKKGRVAAMDEVWDRFRVDFSKETWSKKLFLEKADYYRNKQRRRGGRYKFHAYCNFIAWYFSYYADNYKSMI